MKAFKRVTRTILHRNIITVITTIIKNISQTQEIQIRKMLLLSISVKRGKIFWRNNISYTDYYKFNNSSDVIRNLIFFLSLLDHTGSH